MGLSPLMRVLNAEAVLVNRMSDDKEGATDVRVGYR